MAFSPTVVDGPARQALPYGLFSYLTFRPEGDGRWQMGAVWEPLTCDPVAGIGPGCEDPIGLPKDLDPNNPPIAEAEPFTLYGHYACTPVGHTLAEMQDRAVAHLQAREEAGVENAFWTGDLGNTPNLAGENMDAGSTIVLAGGTAMPIPEGLALLEDFIGANYGSLGAIHMTRGAALQAAGDHLLEVSASSLATEIGTPVVAGAGYPGTGPGGVGAPPAAGSSWAYASPALFGYRTEIFSPSSRPGDGLNRETNLMTTVAERTYLLGFDPCGVAAVLLQTSA